LNHWFASSQHSAFQNPSAWPLSQYFPGVFESGKEIMAQRLVCFGMTRTSTSIASTVASFDLLHRRCSQEVPEYHLINRCMFGKFCAS
jgi:hypothetical protein